MSEDILFVAEFRKVIVTTTGTHTMYIKWRFKSDGSVSRWLERDERSAFRKFGVWWYDQETGMIAVRASKAPNTLSDKRWDEAYQAYLNKEIVN